MKTYELVKNGTGDINVIYYINGIIENVEYYSKEDGSEKAEIREGYILNTK